MDAKKTMPHENAMAWRIAQRDRNGLLMKIAERGWFCGYTDLRRDNCFSAYSVGRIHKEKERQWNEMVIVLSSVAQSGI